MGRISCNVNKDLLPLYVDDVCSEESKGLVEEHLSECEECCEYYEALKGGIPEEAVKEGWKELLSEERMKQAAVSIIKDIRKQISKRQVQAACGAAAAILIFIFVLEGLNGAYVYSALGKIPLFDTRLKASDMHVTELYQLENGYLYITVETEEKSQISICGNWNEIYDKNDRFTGEYEGEIEFMNELWGDSAGTKKHSFIFPVSGEIGSYEGEGSARREDSVIYLVGKGDEKVRIWEKGQAVEKAPPGIEASAKMEMEAEDARRREFGEEEEKGEPYTIM